MGQQRSKWKGRPAAALCFSFQANAEKV